MLLTELYRNECRAFAASGKAKQIADERKQQEDRRQKLAKELNKVSSGELAAQGEFCVNHPSVITRKRQLHAQHVVQKAIHASKKRKVQRAKFSKYEAA